MPNEQRRSGRRGSPSTPPLLISREHGAAAAFWGDEAIRAIQRAIAMPSPTTTEDLDLLFAIRSARIAWFHALKAPIGRR